MMFSDDREFEYLAISPVCSHCGNLIDSGVGRTCQAFQNGIPLTIWNGNNDHKEPVVGDNGIIFISKKPVEA